jgi:hypothetical protein
MILNKKFRQFTVIVQKKNGSEIFSSDTVLVYKDSEIDACFVYDGKCYRNELRLNMFLR